MATKRPRRRAHHPVRGQRKLSCRRRAQTPRSVRQHTLVSRCRFTILNVWDAVAVRETERRTLQNAVWGLRAPLERRRTTTGTRRHAAQALEPHRRTGLGLKVRRESLLLRETSRKQLQRTRPCAATDCNHMKVTDPTPHSPPYSHLLPTRATTASSLVARMSDVKQHVGHQNPC